VTEVSSENPSGADNQQETEYVLALDPWWVVGFVDGEGCFSVSIHRNAGAWHGWQIMPVFHVYQHRDHRDALEALQHFFGCGSIRSKGPGSSVLTYAVQDRSALLQCVIPFFERVPPVVKQRDFRAFATIVRSLAAKEHRNAAGFERLVRLAYGMNANGKQRARPVEAVLGILRDCTPGARPEGGTKIQSDPCGDMRSQAEMT
jgi:LAGLIDADG endonuclease